MLSGLLHYKRQGNTLLLIIYLQKNLNPMNTTLLGKREASLSSTLEVLPGIARAKRQKREKEASSLDFEDFESSCCCPPSDIEATYISDITGAFTPHSCHSTSSKLTWVSSKSRRIGKVFAARVYNLRERRPNSKGGHMSRPIR